MFHKLIEDKRNQWLESSDCTVRELLSYMEGRGNLRDAQLDAIKTYLFLKIACENKPLWQLFTEGTFNSLDIDSLALTASARTVLTTDKAAAALLEYSMLKDRNGKQIAPELERFIREHTDEIDYEAAFRKIFYDVSYTDYLFSLPMGAGKTYLMAAFIYLDLYFALNEPDNPCFAHNFMVFAPSGLKSSIVPSLRKIKEFDPSWIIPEPTASQLWRMVKFEILDEQKTARRSNLVKNPNAQKINNHQPLEYLMGLVAVTNAEKVILDRMEKHSGANVFSEDENYRIKQANDLRDIIGRLPNLAIYIDEVHHASDSSIKLRQVVSAWTEKYTFNSVLGFSGTPYLDKAEDVVLGGNFHIKNTQLANVVYYYPLMNGLGNFLKIPEVKYADGDTETIVRNGINEFLEKYKDTTYGNGTCAKLAVYCGQIETLEEQVYPLAAVIAASHGLEPAASILRYHGGSKKYPQHKGAETEFASLDTSLSKVRIVLLVQIGKEGWDCKSLTGVVLPQKGVCPTNMVLQTSCRCLRQIRKGDKETAMIWLNQFNADTLNRQLKQQQNISIQEFSDKRAEEKLVRRFSRMEHVQLTPVDFYQLRITYQTQAAEDGTNTASRLSSDSILRKAAATIIHQQDMDGTVRGVYEEQQSDNELITYNHWLQLIAKESFGTLTVKSLKEHTDGLTRIFSRIVVTKDDGTYLSHNFNHSLIRSLIRQAFIPRRKLHVHEDIIHVQASLLKEEKLAPASADDKALFCPQPKAVEDIIEWDAKPAGAPISPEVMKRIKELKALGVDVSSLKLQADPHPEREYTYHYLPYHFDSRLEMEFFTESIIPIIHRKNLEIYFNGDDTLTEFKIDCYKKEGGEWRKTGRYVPDFLLLSRTADGQLHKILIIETKGEAFAAKFTDKRQFMETAFVQQNNEKAGYRRFGFLYLEDAIGKEERERRTIEAINRFFND